MKNSAYVIVTIETQSILVVTVRDIKTLVMYMQCSMYFVADVLLSIPKPIIMLKTINCIAFVFQQ